MFEIFSHPVICEGKVRRNVDDESAGFQCRKCPLDIGETFVESSIWVLKSEIQNFVDRRDIQPTEQLASTQYAVGEKQPKQRLSGLCLPRDDDKVSLRDKVFPRPAQGGAIPIPPMRRVEPSPMCRDAPRFR